MNNDFTFFEMDKFEDDSLGDPKNFLRSDFATEIDNHFEKYFGKSPFVIHENTEEIVHVDVHVIPPSDRLGLYILYTTGMSSRHMNVPPEYERQKFGELVICLPPDWCVSMDAFREDPHYFLPVYWLKKFARYPHEYHTWLAPGHTVDNEEPYFDGTELSCMFFAPLAIMGLGEEMSRLNTSDGEVINFSLLMPVYKSEMEYKLKNDSAALIDKLVKHDISYVLDFDRKNVCN